MEHTFDNITAYGLVCGREPEQCQKSENESSLFYWILAGELIMGLGFSGFMTLGMSYLHDSSSFSQRAYNQGRVSAFRRINSVFLAEKAYTLNQGILLTIFIAGPLISFGFVLPTVSIVFYVDFYRGETNMDYHDPEWVGAWWLGSGCPKYSQPKFQEYNIPNILELSINI